MVTMRKVQECAAGNLVFLELSGCKFGHHAPLMRTAYVLKPEVRPTETEQRFIWNSYTERFQDTTAKDQLLWPCQIRQETEAPAWLVEAECLIRKTFEV